MCSAVCFSICLSLMEASCSGAKQQRCVFKEQRQKIRERRKKKGKVGYIKLMTACCQGVYRRERKKGFYENVDSNGFNISTLKVKVGRFSQLSLVAALGLPTQRNLQQLKIGLVKKQS